MGFSLVSKQGKGSHRKLRHPLLSDSYSVSGQEGDDAERYQEKQLRQARAALEKARKKP
jgi:predicted RNA binding protein YcfA (HicA-like mRNA interferase family)